MGSGLITLNKLPDEALDKVAGGPARTAESFLLTAELQFRFCDINYRVRHYLIFRVYKNTC